MLTKEAKFNLESKIIQLMNKNKYLQRRPYNYNKTFIRQKWVEYIRKWIKK